jgi:hypothetical protein
MTAPLQLQMVSTTMLIIAVNCSVFIIFAAGCNYRIILLLDMIAVFDCSFEAF